MQILNLKLKNFRNYTNLNLNFDQLNILYGNNGSGKTNIIEAIYVLALTKSFRGSTQDIIIQKGYSSTKIIANIKQKIKNKYEINISKEGKSVLIDNTKYNKVSEYISKIQVVLFNPDDLNIIKDSPIYRRKYLNIQISQLNNKYVVMLNNYNKLVKQRNSYLKTLYLNSLASHDYIDILTDKIIKYGMEIFNNRVKYIKLINDNIGKYYRKITNSKDSLVIEYHSDYENMSYEDIKSKYTKLFEKEMMFGKTLFGIHKDDFKFVLRGNCINDFGSEGQQKNAIISLKLSEVDIFKKLTKENPILILDDLFSELDKKKIDNILNNINNDVQTFITVTEIEKVEQCIIDKSKIFEIKKGKVKEKHNERRK